MLVVRSIIASAPKRTFASMRELGDMDGQRTLPLDRAKVGNSRIPSVHEIRSRDRKASTAADANEDEAARAERGGYQTARQTSG